MVLYDVEKNARQVDTTKRVSREEATGNGGYYFRYTSEE